jgi:hypothetical protein
MSEIAAAIAHIRAVADQVGLVELAREAGVPYTTVRSFAGRKWSHKSVDVIEKLSEAAKRLAAPEPEKPKRRRVA